MPLEFVQKELKLRWSVEGDLQVSLISEGVLMFILPIEEVKHRVLNKGPWSLAGQLLALEEWRSNFKPSRDVLKQLRVWVRLPEPPLELWDKEKILRIASVAGKSLFLDEWTAASSRIGFARVCCLVRGDLPICRGTKVRVNDASI